MNLASPEQVTTRHERMQAAYAQRQEQEAGMRQARALLRKYLQSEAELVEIMSLGCARLIEANPLDTDNQLTIQLVDEVCDAITYRYAS